jgi:hypothetical protein
VPPVKDDFDYGCSPRVLRWEFEREDRTMTCQLALNPQALLFEFSTSWGQGVRSTTVERFVEVGRAFTRQCEYESTLIADGWTLQSYESRPIDHAA